MALRRIRGNSLSEGRLASRPFRFADLFCGIGGFRVAAQRLGGMCVFSSEIDRHACDTYWANFGERPSGDITKILSAEVPEHDLLFGGFPCQAFSTAGNRMGFEDARGTLIWEVARIVRDRRPKAFVLENVPGLLTHDGGRTFGTVLRLLGNDRSGGEGFCGMGMPDGAGYDLLWAVLNAAGFGLAQNRERVIIVGFRPDMGWRGFRFPAGRDWSKRISDILELEVPERYWLTERQVAKIRERIAKNCSPAGFLAAEETYVETEYANLEGKAGCPTGFGTSKKCLDFGKARHLVSVGGDSRFPVRSPGERSGTVPASYSSGGAPHFYRDLVTVGRIGFNDERIAGEEGRRLVLLAGRDSAQNVQVRLEGKYKYNARCLSSEDRSSVLLGSYGAGQKQDVVLPDGVRAFTPRECARLQGFPDSFMPHPVDRHAYRQFGNAVPVPVVQAVIGAVLDVIFGKERCKGDAR